MAAPVHRITPPPLLRVALRSPDPPPPPTHPHTTTTPAAPLREPKGAAPQCMLTQQRISAQCKESATGGEHQRQGKEETAEMNQSASARARSRSGRGQLPSLLRLVAAKRASDRLDPLVQRVVGGVLQWEEQWEEQTWAPAAASLQRHTRRVRACRPSGGRTCLLPLSAQEHAPRYKTRPRGHRWWGGAASGECGGGEGRQEVR